MFNKNELRFSKQYTLAWTVAIVFLPSVSHYKELGKKKLGMVKIVMIKINF